MKWTLILRLSAIGLAVALGSVFFISPNVEPLIWLAAFLYYAYAIGNGSRTWRFLHGLMLGILNSVWVAGVHDIFLGRYLAGHLREVSMIEMVHTAGIASSSRAIMTATGITVGALEGVVIGVFAVVAGMMARPRLIGIETAPELIEPETET